MTKEELAMKIDAYADAKSSGNKYLVKKMIQEMEVTLQNFSEMKRPLSQKLK